jgi:glucuronyl/N-acetylglucosaminyl transferase EXT1
MKLHEFIELSSLFVVFANGKCRRLLIIALALLLIIITLLIYYYPSSTSVPKIGHNNHPTSYIKWIDVSRRIDVPFHLINHQCSMSSCFNRTKCTSPPYRVYVYPDINNDTKRSDSYSKILKVIRDSRLYTSNATEACLFILSIDTLDRDKLSTNFVHDIDERIDALPVNLWNGGNNHIIFNLYHGTYPDYGDHDLKFRLGNAIIARASASVQHFRVNFDISLPLFHRELPIRSTVEVIIFDTSFIIIFIA